MLHLAYNIIVYCWPVQLPRMALNTARVRLTLGGTRTGREILIVLRSNKRDPFSRKSRGCISTTPGIRRGFVSKKSRFIPLRGSSPCSEEYRTVPFLSHVRSGVGKAAGFSTIGQSRVIRLVPKSLKSKQKLEPIRYWRRASFGYIASGPIVLNAKDITACS